MKIFNLLHSFLAIIFGWKYIEITVIPKDDKPEGDMFEWTRAYFGGTFKITKSGRLIRPLWVIPCANVSPAIFDLNESDNHVHAERMWEHKVLGKGLGDDPGIYPLIHIYGSDTDQSDKNSGVVCIIWVDDRMHLRDVV